MSEPLTIQRGVFRICCDKPANLEAERLTASLTVKTCRECGARHFEATALPGALGLKGT